MTYLLLHSRPDGYTADRKIPVAHCVEWLVARERRVANTI
jgi:hypothetical protein